jgi:hypothetical protein
MTLIAITMDDDTAAISPYSHFHQEFRRVLHLDARLRLLLHALPSAMSAALESTTGSPDGFPPEDCKVQWGALTRPVAGDGKRRAPHQQCFTEKPLSRSK